MSRALQWMVATVTSAQSFIYWPMYVHEVYELEEEEELFLFRVWDQRAQMLIPVWEKQEVRRLKIPLLRDSR